MERTPEQQSIREAIAKALFDHALKELTEEVGRQEFDDERFGAICLEAIRENDRSATILLFALIDAIIKDHFRGFLNPKLPGGVRPLISGLGLLAPAGARTTLAYGLYWLSDETYSDVKNVAKVRNIFAHDPATRLFGDPTVLPFVHNLHPIEPGLLKAYSEGKDRMLTPREDFLSRTIFLAYTVARELAIRPRAVRFRVPPEAMGLANDTPNLRKLFWAASEAIVKIINGPEVSLGSHSSDGSTPDAATPPDVPNGASITGTP